MTVEASTTALAIALAILIQNLPCNCLIKWTPRPPHTTPEVPVAPIQFGRAIDGILGSIDPSPRDMLCRTKEAAPSGRCRSSRLYGFDLDRQLHLLPKSHLPAEADSEVAAIEGGGSICTADFLVGHRIFLTQKTTDGES